jgi:pentatricopeptide repeat protein
MIGEFEVGRTELQPDTTSFNTVLDALAKSKEENVEHRAEALLRKMEDLASLNASLSSTCRPDHVVRTSSVPQNMMFDSRVNLFCALPQSFNIVLNCWAQIKSREGAMRATSILKHMEQRYNTNNTNIHPDAASYTTVINAWSRSRDSNTVKRAEEVLHRAEEAQEQGHLDVKLNTLTYNSMINCYAKSILPDAADRALSILEMLQVKGLKEGGRRFQPDIVTYTSVIDALAKKATLEASEKAETLLSEVETAFEQSGDTRLRPNIRTYTSVSYLRHVWRFSACKMTTNQFARL